jgi:hypothetical protein
MGIGGEVHVVVDRSGGPFLFHRLGRHNARAHEPGTLAETATIRRASRSVTCSQSPTALPACWGIYPVVIMTWAGGPPDPSNDSTSFPAERPPSVRWPMRPRARQQTSGPAAFPSFESEPDLAERAEEIRSVELGR